MSGRYFAEGGGHRESFTDGPNSFFLPVQVGCSQLLKESEKPLQGEAPSGQSENLSSNSPGGDSASVGEFQHQEA